MVSEPSEATALPPKGDPDTLYVVDVSGYVFRAYHALPPLSSPAGEATHAVLGTTTMVQKLVQEHAPAMLAMAFDSPGASFRDAMFDGYKAHRPPAPPDLPAQMARVQEIVEAYRFPVLRQSGMEADDLIASVVKQARARGLKVVVVSSDKDLMQLVGDGVWMLDTVRGVVFGAPEVEAKMGVPPALIGDYLALVGDSSDNVPGVPSVGPKTAVALLKEHGSLDGVYANVERIEKKGLKQKLIDHKADAELSRKLVALKDDLAVDVSREHLVGPGPDVEKLAALFRELGFGRLLTQLPASQAEKDGKDAGKDGTTQAASKAASRSASKPASGEQQSLLGEAPPAAAVSDVEVIADEAALAALGAALQRAEHAALYCVLEGVHPVSGALVGIGVSFGGRCAYVPVGHEYLGCPSQLSAERVIAALAPALRAATPRKVCADSKVERMALAVREVELAGVDFDVMLASYLIDPEGHGHALDDVARFELQSALGNDAKRLLERRAEAGTLSGMTVESMAAAVGEVLQAIDAAHAALAPKLDAIGCASLLGDMELPLSRVLARVELTGVRLDVAHCAKLSVTVREQMATLEQRCHELAGHAFNVGSPRQLETILFDELSLPVIKRTKTARSTDHEVLEELAAKHALPAAILEHRMLAKLEGTYLQALPAEVNPKTGRIHTDFRQAVAATGRLSSSDPNLQNIPIRSELGRSIRDAFVPREGWQMLSADYSQIELRVLAHLSHDPELCDAFAKDADVHTRTARALFGVAEDAVTREMRGTAKTVNYAVIYGQTQFALARNLRIERGEAARYIHAFFAQYAGVASYLEQIVEQARESGEVRTLAGRVRKLPDLRSTDRVRRQAAERVARNTPIQGTAADIMKLAMIGIFAELERRAMHSRMLLTVHDELVFEAPPEERESLESLVKERMEHVLALDVPLVVDAGWGATWGKAH